MREVDGELPASRLHGVLPTYHRPAELADTLRRLGEQDRLLDRLVVVDNGADEDTERTVREQAGKAFPIEYLSPPENLGFAGGVGVGMEHVARDADDLDWVVVLDDDDPPVSRAALADRERFARRMLHQDPRTAGVGGHGGRFDWRRGRVRRVTDGELTGPVALDYLGGNSMGLYLVRVIREAGAFSRAVFFGLSELEYCLRLRRAGHTFYADGDAWREARSFWNRTGVRSEPTLRLPQLDWRRYYSLRNLIHILRSHGRSGTALRVCLIQGLGKPVANFPLSPRLAAAHLRLNVRACRDGWAGRMGRTLEPEPWGVRPLKDAARASALRSRSG